MGKNELSSIESGLIEGGKNVFGVIAKKILDEKQLEEILVQAGEYIANYESDGTEESELRQIVFSADNMRMLARAMQAVDEFHWMTVLEQNIGNLLDKSAMSEDNKERCKTHFMEIVRTDLAKIYPQTYERTLALRTNDNTVAIMGQILEIKQSIGRTLYEIVESVQKENLSQERQEQSDRNAVDTRKDNGKSVRAKKTWNLKTLHVKGIRASKTAEKEEILTLTQIWRQERKNYPGWYIMPYSIRKKLELNTREEGLLQCKDVVSCEEMLEFCYEYVWRCEKGMLLYDMRIQKNIRSIWNEYAQKIQEDEETERRAYWFYIGQALLREYREDGQQEEWRTIYRCLKAYETYGSDELCMEKMKYEFSNIHIGMVKRGIDRWSIPKERYELRLQVIGLMAECGETDEALQKLAGLKQDIVQKKQEELQEDYALFLESLRICMLQLESLLVQGCAFRDRQYEQRQEKINRIVEEIEAGKEYFDWQNVLYIVNRELLSWYAKKYEKKNPFELNRESVTIFASANYCEEGYYLYRIMDALAVPLESNHVTLISSLELPWICSLLQINFRLGLFMLLRGSKLENCEKLIDHRYLAGLGQDLIVSAIRFLMGALEQNLEELAEIENQGNGSILYLIQQNAPGLLCRFMSRCPENLQKEALMLLKRMMEQPDLELNGHMDVFVAGIMRQISERNKAEMLGTLLDTKICEHRAFYGNEVPIDIFDCYFRKSNLEALQNYCRVEQRQIEDLLYMEETSIYVWRTKVARLQVLYDMKLLSIEQKQQFVKLVWSRVDEKTKMPDLPNQYVWSYMKLPYDRENTPAVSIKALFLHSGLLSLFGREEGCKFTMGEIRYLDELYAMALGLEKDFWSAAEVECIYQDAVDYWEVLKDKLQMAAHDFTEREYRNRAGKIVRMMAEVYKSISYEISKEMQDKVRNMLDDMKNMDIDTMQLKVLFLTEAECDEMAEKICQGIYAAIDTTAVDALSAAYTYISKYPKNPHSQILLGEMIQMMRARKTPGLISVIYLLHNLFYMKCEIITEEAVSKIDMCLVRLAEATKYTDHMESDRRIKEMVSIRKACASLAFQMYRWEKGDAGEGVMFWKKICCGDEFAEIKNEWYL